LLFEPINTKGVIYASIPPFWNIRDKGWELERKGWRIRTRFRGSKPEPAGWIMVNGSQDSNGKLALTCSIDSSASQGAQNPKRGKESVHFNSGKDEDFDVYWRAVLDPKEKYGLSTQHRLYPQVGIIAMLSARKEKFSGLPLVRVIPLEVRLAARTAWFYYLWIMVASVTVLSIGTLSYLVIKRTYPSEGLQHEPTEGEGPDWGVPVWSGSSETKKESESQSTINVDARTESQRTTHAAQNSARTDLLPTNNDEWGMPTVKETSLSNTEEEF
jgi:hypothetical protein